MGDPHTGPPESASGPAGERNSQPKYQLTEDQLLAIFKEKQLCSFLAAVVQDRVLVSIAPRLGLSPLPGKRLKTMRPKDHALLLARSSLEEQKPRKAVLEALNAHLPPPLLPLGCQTDPDTSELLLSVADRLRPEVRIGLILSLMTNENLVDSVMKAIEDGLLDSMEDPRQSQAEEETKKLKTQLARAQQRAEKAEQTQLADVGAVQERENSLRARIEELQHQVTELQEKLGRKNHEYDDVHAEWERLKEDLRVAFRRAARYKNALDETRKPDEREKELQEELTRERQRADIEASKLEILEYQLDILQQEDESEAETRIIRKNDPVPGHVLQYVEKIGRAPRVLVVGGAGQQRAHRERDFSNLKQQLGIDGEWRFADYTSWHRELPRLRNDIRGRFDLVFVLHWNRTTFVQKMHDEARAAEARVRTVPYRGFLSLERAVREEIDRFVQEKI